VFEELGLQLILSCSFPEKAIGPALAVISKWKSEINRNSTLTMRQYDLKVYPLDLMQEALVLDTTNTILLFMVEQRNRNLICCC
jgi:hypothetical protein